MAKRFALDIAEPKELIRMVNQLSDKSWLKFNNLEVLQS
jgi:hypothetical protein